MAKHEHDYSQRTTYEQKIGKEYVTVEQVKCSCGKLMLNNVVGRRPAN